MFFLEVVLGLFWFDKDWIEGKLFPIFDVTGSEGTSFEEVEFPKGLPDNAPIGFVFGGSFGTNDSSFLV